MPNTIGQEERAAFLKALKEIKNNLEKNYDQKKVAAHKEVIEKIEGCENMATMFNSVADGYGGAPRFVVAKDGDLITGVGVMVERDGQWTINDAVGLPGHGAGRDLADEMITHAMQNTEKEVRLISLNEKSTALWEKYSFKSTVNDGNTNNIPMALVTNDFVHAEAYIQQRQQQNNINAVNNAQEKPKVKEQLEAKIEKPKKEKQNLAAFAKPINVDKKEIVKAVQARVKERKEQQNKSNNNRKDKKRSKTI